MAKKRSSKITLKLDPDLVIKLLTILILGLAITTIIIFLIKSSSQKQTATNNLQTQEEIEQESTTIVSSPATTKKTSPTPKPTTTSDTEEILDAVRRYVRSHSGPDQKFTVRLESKVKKGRDEYALVHIDPIPIGSAEPAGAVLQKIGGLWIVMDFGTLLMEWHERVPELFNF